MITNVTNEEYEQSQQEENPAVDVSAGRSGEREKKKDFFAIWHVGGQDFQLKLRTVEQMELEKLYKRNVFALMGDADNLPTLTTMLQVTHAAMKPWHHGIKLKAVQDLYEKYLGEGGSMLQFYVDVYMKIYAVSGFFSSSMEEDLTDAMEKMSEEMK